MKTLFPSYVRVPLLFAAVFCGLEYAIDSGDKPAFIEYPILAVFLFIFLFLLIAVEIVAKAASTITNAILTEEQRELLKAKERENSLELKLKSILNKLTGSKSIDEEQDVMLEHDYDGIKELDNVLPPWWVNLFYVTIIFAVIYLVRFHVLDGYTQAEEYQQEVELANAELERIRLETPKEEITLDQVVLLTDSESLAKGKEIYTNACAACHRADGGGLVGPNLADEYWINGGGVKNIFKVIADGSPNNPSMVAWKRTLDSKDIQKIASYIVTLQGTKPAGAKAAEGEKWVEVEETTTTVTDTVAVATK
jgi:cytochrome c oxidase cbb3-type subunit 3